MKKNTKRKRYSVFSNVVYITKYIHSWDRSALPIHVLQSPLRTVSSLAYTYFAPALIALIEKDKGVLPIMAAAAAFTLLFIVLENADNRFARIADMKRVENGRRFSLLLCEKIMDMDFELLEGPLGRDKYQKAKNSMENSGVYGFFDSLFYAVSAVLAFTGNSVVIGMLNPWIIVILLATQGLALVTDLFTDRLVDKTKDKQAQIDRRLNYMTKNSRDFLIAKDVRLYKMRDCLQRMSEYFIGEKKFWTNKVYLYYFVSDVTGLFSGAVIKGGVYAYLLYTAFTSDFAGSQIVLYLSAILGFGRWISGVGDSFNELYSSNLKVNDLREFMDIQNAMNCGAGLPLPEKTPYEIEVRNLSFTYPQSEHTVLDDLSFIIKSGEKVALVGMNGAGKTTLVKLLCGLYRPSGGQVFINGVDISLLNRDEYYQTVSAVFQDARVMPISVASNVSMKTEEKTDSNRVENCLRLAGLTEKINALPNGADTLLVKNVNDGGAELSGGEMQKLMLARAIYKDASVIILDEPTAALDPIAENEMYLKYCELTKDRTSLYISHRLSSTRFCDRIFLLHDARLIETGTHDELMALGGKYAEIFAVQSKYYNEETQDDEI